MAGAAPAAPETPAPETTPDRDVIELIDRWVRLSELEKRTFVALAREITSSSQVVEASTQELSSRFQDLAHSAQAQAGRVNSIVDVAKSLRIGDETIPLDEGTRFVETVLVKVIDTILLVSKHAMRMVYALDDVLADVDIAEKCVQTIDGLNRQTRFLALNANIEAQRSGAGGGAFRVIAQEVKQLSQAMDATSATVRNQIAAVARGVREGHTMLRDIATIDMSEHIRAKERLDALLAGMVEQNRAFTYILAEAASASGELSETIARLVTGIQFQDRTKQQLDHVVGTLDVLRAATESLQLATKNAVPSLDEKTEIDSVWLHRIVEGQTMSAMRARILGELTAEDGDDERTPAAAVAPEDGDVELF